MITTLENYRESAVKPNSTGRECFKLMSCWDYEKNTIDPANEILDLSERYYWTCKNGHTTYQTVPQFRFGECVECDRVFFHLNDFGNYIALSNETIEELTSVFKDDFELNFLNCSERVQGVISHVTYTFDTGLISNEILEAYSKLKVFTQRESDGKYLINRDLSLIPHTIAFAKLKSVKDKYGKIKYDKLSHSVALWLQYTLASYRKTHCVSKEVINELKKFGVINATDDKLCEDVTLFYNMNKYKKVEMFIDSDGKVVKSEDEIWYNLLQTVMYHVNLRGHFECLKKVEVDEVNLHKWFVDQVSKYRKGALRQQRREWMRESNLEKKYRELKMIDSKWFKYYELLKLYLSDPELKRVFYRGTKYKYKSLGYWLHQQKELIDEGKMAPQVMELFEKINFDFSWCHKSELQGSLDKDDDDKTKWETGLMHLIDFRLKYGCTNVPFTFVLDDGFDLGYWTYHRRRRYNENIMTTQRKSIYKLLGFDDRETKPTFYDDKSVKSDVEFKEEVKWRNMYDKVADALKDKNAENVLDELMLVDVRYYNWAIRQQTLHKNGQLLNLRIEKLKKIKLIN